MHLSDKKNGPVHKLFVEHALKVSLHVQTQLSHDLRAPKILKTLKKEYKIPKK